MRLLKWLFLLALLAALALGVMEFMVPRGGRLTAIVFWTIHHWPWALAAVLGALLVVWLASTRRAPKRRRKAAGR